MKSISWKRIEAWVEAKRGQVSPAEVAKRFGPHPTTVSRHFKMKGIALDVGRHRERVSVRIVKGLALFFLGFNREQVHNLLGIKTKTLSNYLLRLVPKHPAKGGGTFRMFDPGGLALRLEAAWKRIGIDPGLNGIMANLPDCLLGADRSVLQLLTKGVQGQTAQDLAQQVRRLGLKAVIQDRAVRVSSSRGEVRMTNFHRG